MHMHPPQYNPDGAHGDIHDLQFFVTSTDPYLQKITILRLSANFSKYTKNHHCTYYNTKTETPFSKLSEHAMKNDLKFCNKKSTL